MVEKDQKSDYVNCNLVLGSAAEAVRIWSIEMHVRTVQRRSMFPQLFEYLIFLKAHERFWNEQLVSEDSNSILQSTVKI